MISYLFLEHLDTTLYRRYLSLLHDLIHLLLYLFYFLRIMLVLKGLKCQIMHNCIYYSEHRPRSIFSNCLQTIYNYTSHVAVLRRDSHTANIENGPKVSETVSKMHVKIH
jgi:hypothetical protein